jgi:hypothetical protein
MARAGTHYTVPLVTLMAIGAAIAMARRPKLAAYAVACSCVMALFFNVTVLHFGRHLYPPDPAGYAQARAVALSARPYVSTRPITRERSLWPRPTSTSVSCRPA